MIADECDDTDTASESDSEEKTGNGLPDVLLNHKFDCNDEEIINNETEFIFQYCDLR